MSIETRSFFLLFHINIGTIIIMKSNNKEKKDLTPAQKNIIYLICTIVTAVCIMAAVTIYITNRDAKKFVYEDNYDKVLVTVGSMNITLKDASYYIMRMEAEVDKLAKVYDRNNPLAYWSVRIGSNYVRPHAKKTVMGYMIRDAMYCLEGQAMGLEPDHERIIAINDDVTNTLKSMTSQQMEFTNLTYSELYNILYRIEMAKLYISAVTAGNNLLTEEDFNEGGSYYESIYKKYSSDNGIDIDDDLWDKITLGKLTING